MSRGCTIKINLLGFKNLYHCFLETVRIFAIPNLLYLFEKISEFRLGAIYLGTPGYYVHKDSAE